MNIRRPQQNPLPALIITLMLTGALAAAGLFFSVLEPCEQSGKIIQAVFTPPQKQEAQQYALSMRTLPTMNVQPHCESTIFFQPQEAPQHLPEQEKLTTSLELPLLLMAELTAPEPPVRITNTTRRRRVPPQTAIRQEQDTYTPPAPLNTPSPAYPSALRSSRRTGLVQLRIHINTEGKPTSVEIISSNHPAFAETARNHILSHWKFSPAIRNGKAVPATAIQKIHFQP